MRRANCIGKLVIEMDFDVGDRIDPTEVYYAVQQLWEEGELHVDYFDKSGKQLTYEEATDV